MYDKEISIRFNFDTADALRRATSLRDALAQLREPIPDSADESAAAEAICSRFQDIRDAARDAARAVDELLARNLDSIGADAAEQLHSLRLQSIAIRSGKDSGDLPAADARALSASLRRQSALVPLDAANRANQARLGSLDDRAALLSSALAELRAECIRAKQAFEQIAAASPDHDSPAYRTALTRYNEADATAAELDRLLSVTARKQQASRSRLASSSLKLDQSRKHAGELDAAEAQALQSAKQARAARVAGREAAKQQAEYNRAISKELSDITRHYKLTGKYGEEDRRTEKDIRDCDRTALEAKQKELKDLLGRTSDAETRARIQEALEDTEKAQRALAAATEKAAKKASMDLADKKMPEFHAKDKMLNRSLQNLSKSYARYAAKAEKAAREGDTEAAAKYQKRMNNMADRMGRLDEADKKVAKRRMDMYKRTGYDNREETKAEKMKREDNERLAQIAEERSKEYRHVKKAGEQQKRQAAAQARQANQAAQVPAASPQAAQQAAQGQQAALSEANAQLAQMVQSAESVATATEKLAATCRDANKRLRDRLKNIEKEIDLIRKEVNA